MMKKIIASLLIVGNTFMYRLLPKDAGGEKEEGKRDSLFHQRVMWSNLLYLWPILYL